MYKLICSVGLFIIALLPAIGQVNATDTLFPYYIQNQEQMCNTSDFVCMPIVSADTLQNCIGLEMVLKYNTQKVSPTGIINIGNQLINPAYVSVSNTLNENMGTISIIVFLNINAPSGTGFNGRGTVMCVEFVKTVNFQVADTSIFSIDVITESYNTQTLEKQVGSGRFVSFRDKFFHGNVVYWSDNAPLSYNTATPNQYLPTSVFGCTSGTTNAIFPDVAGKFVYNTDNGINFTINREIAATTSIQSVVNGFDAMLLAKVLKDENFVTTNIYQFLAMDVNMDGKISAGDLSQISQRSVLKISEFKQAWNYNDQGIKVVDKPSRDWVFIDLKSLQNNASYRKSAVYPDDDNVGFSKYRVPLSADCFAVPMDINNECNFIYKEKYFGIMLGDVNGNYKYIPTDGKLKSTNSNNKISINLSKAIINGETIKIPVFANADTSIESLDFSIHFNEKKMIFQHIEAGTTLNPDYYYSPNDKILRFCSWTLSPVQTSEPIAWLCYSNLTEKLTISDFWDPAAYFNGTRVNAEIVETQLNNDAGGNIKIYPLPASSYLTLETSTDINFRILNLEGKCIHNGYFISSGSKELLDISGLKAGVYLLETMNNGMYKVIKIVKE